MASESTGPFDGRFPPTSYPADDEGYEDVLGIHQQSDGLDLPMPDQDDDDTTPASVGECHAIHNGEAHSPRGEVELQSEDESMMDLPDLDTLLRMNHNKTANGGTQNGRKHSANGEAALTESDRIRSLLNSSTGDDEAMAEAQDSSGRPARSDEPTTDQDIVIKQEDVKIKQEEPRLERTWDRSIPTEVIELSDTEVMYKYGTEMSNGTILLSDGEDEGEEIIVNDDGSTQVAIKKKNQDVEFLGANKSLVETPEDSSSEDEQVLAPKPNLGMSLLRTPNPKAQRTPADFEKMKRMQRLYAERAIGKQVVTGAGRVFKVPNVSGTHESQTIGHGGGNGDYAWMSDTVVLDESSETEFQTIKQKYRAKKKARQNTWADDVEFKKAQDKENARIKRLAREAEDSDDNEADEGEDSDDGLFFSGVPRPPPSSKRAYEATIEDDDEEGNDDCTTMGKQTDNRSRPNIPSKAKRKNAFNRELHSNMLAGIESFLSRERQKAVRASEKEAEKDAVKNGKTSPKAKKGSKKSVAPPKRSKVTRTGATTDIGSLVSSNVYEDANANLGYKALPIISEKRKQDAITSILASVPIEDRKKATTDMHDINRASVILGSRKVLPDGEGGWSFKGMRTSLYNHQVQGAARMKERETGSHQPLGGILADEMGLGKTLMTLGIMIANRAALGDPYRCTLIVCSPALMTQWYDELEKHVEEEIFERVVRHNPGERVSGKGAVLALEQANVVLTTYQEVVRSYPKCKIPKDIKGAEAKEAWWVKEWEQKRDLLHRAQFYRIVLDEAQAIKNYKSQTSIACRALMAKHRWAISGTPIQNRLEELYPYFKFLRVKHTGSYPIFQQNFCLKGSDVCNARLHALLDQMMIRRTHKDKLLGVPLVQLPKNTMQTVRLKFNEVEKIIYRMVRIRCIKAINRFASFGTAEEHLKMLMIMFQRLRQMTAHIFMVQEVIEKEYELADIDDSWAETVPKMTEHENPERDMVVALKRMLADREDPDRDKTKNPSAGADMQDSQSKPSDSRKPSTLATKFGRYLRDLRKNGQWTELKDRTLCTSCVGPPEDPIVTSCFHIYCKECLSNLAYEASKSDQDETPCKKCEVPYTESLSCEGLKELEVEDLTDKIAVEGKEPKKFKLTMEYVDSDDKILLSTKTTAVVAQLEQWIKDNPDRKIIVFSEWHLVFHVLGRICDQKGWKSCFYNGKMSHKARDKTLSDFKSKPEIQIMIASLKCGGQGLNLTVASKVICVDLWFNSGVEQQAFCRVFRIGQDKETYITRFAVEGTVDDKLIEMQETKKAIISAALDDREVLSKLSLEELMRLFGEVAYDENSKPFILVDDEEEVRSKRPPCHKA